VLAVEGQDANGELVQRASLLVWLIKALTRETVRQPMNALELFREAEGKLTGWDNAAAWSVFYYFMGRTALLVQDLPEAQRTLNLAVAKNGDNAPAQIALGNFYYTLAQLYFTRQQPLAQPVAACAADFSDTGIDVNAIATSSPLVPPDYAGAEAALRTAQAQYEVAQALATDQQVPELYSLARLMQASAHRLAGEGALFALAQAESEANDALLAQAQAELDAAEGLYRETIEPFTQARRFGLLAYAWNGLGLTARARGYLQRQQQKIEQARQSYAAAIDHFAACQAQRNQRDRNGDAELQKKMDCFCAAWGAEVEQEYINLGGGEG
jgi:tetratricopeptide (TPR) repeat protein